MILKKTKKILMISSTSKLGGGPIQMFTLGNSLSNEFEVFYAIPNGINFSKYLKDKKYIFISERKINFKDIIKLVYYVFKNDIDIIHAHGKGASAIARITKLFVWKPIIYTYHGIHLECHSFTKKIIYLIYEYLTGFFDKCKIFVSQSEMNYARSFFFNLGLESHIIFNGVQNKKIKYASKRNSEINHLNFQNKIKVVSVCRFVKQKNIKGIICIAEKAQNLDFFIIGEGPLWKEINNLILEKELKNIFLLGKKNDVYKYLYDSDIYLSASLYEGLPLSILEAMSVGLPIVASDVTGNCDTLEDKISGYLFKPNDFEAAARFLKKLALNKECRLKLGNAAFIRQRELFSIEKMIISYQNIYKKIL